MSKLSYTVFKLIVKNCLILKNTSINFMSNTDFSFLIMELFIGNYKGNNKFNLILNGFISKESEQFICTLDKDLNDKDYFYHYLLSLFLRFCS